MTWLRVGLSAALVAWLLILGLLLQPRSTGPPLIIHAHPLERQVGNLPTLGPGGP